MIVITRNICSKGIYLFFVYFHVKISQRDREFNSYSGIHILHFSREFVSAKLGRLNNGGISNISGARLNENIGTRRGSSINSKDRVVKAKLPFRPWLEYLPQYRKKVFDAYELIFHARETYYTSNQVTFTNCCSLLILIQPVG